MTTLPAGTPNAGKKVITRWGTDVNHAMTFVGYDDNVRYDYNGDGQYTNNKDINGDGVIDMRDWEVGAVIAVNSWGTGWGDNGHCYVPYRLLAETPANGGIWNHSIMVIEVAPQTNPLLVLKVKVKYTARARINLTASMNTNTSATTGVNAKTFELAKNRGGDLFMQGGTTEDQKTIEYALDISSFMQYISNYQPVKLFFTVNENDPSSIGTGSIVSMSVIDYISGQNYPAEVVCSQSNKTINQGATTVSVVKNTWGNSQTFRNPENPANTVNGLDYKYYQGDWNSLPNFAALTPITSSTIANFTISGAQQGDYFGYSFTGYVNVPTDGVYTFYTNSDDGSRLYIGSTLVVGNDGLHPAVEQSGQIGLKAGKHAVRVEFFEKTGGQVLEVRYQGPGISKQLIPNSALYRIEQISANDVLGYYMRLPVLNTWHTGVIEMSGSTMQWRNSAGVSWPLIPDLANEKLLTTSACPYYSNANGKAFILETKQNSNGTKTVEGFWFLNELYSMSSNIAKGKPTSQSSTYPGGDSYKAVDGNTNGAWANGSVTHTQNDAQAWWYVDLGAACNVQSVILWNRAECSERLSNFHIDYFDVNGYFMLRKDYPGTAGSKTVIDFPADGVRFVMVQLNGTNYLSLAEVEVMGIVGGANPGGQAEITKEVIPAGVSGKLENKELIKDVRLFQNNPNPFNSGTLISYQLPTNGRVEIVVYNMAGQKVRTLFDGMAQAGSHQVKWDGRNQSGQALSAGVYVLRLNTGGSTQTRKLMLVR